MPSTFNTLFDHVTPGVVREAMVKAVLVKDSDLVVVPGAGRFDAVLALARGGFPPAKIVASDITFFGSVIGHLADPGLALDMLEVELVGDGQRFAEGVDWADPFERAAAAMIAMRYERIPSKHLYGMNLRRELLYNRPTYQRTLAQELRDLVAIVEGVSFVQEDVRDSVASFLERPDAGAFLNPPSFSPVAFVRLLHSDLVSWKRVTPNEPWDKAALAVLYEQLTDAPLFSMVYSVQGELAPDSWQRLLAVSRKGGMTDYLVANQPIALTHAVTIFTQTNRQQPRIFEIYDDQEITPQTTLEFVEIDRPTALYYRDLFVHRLGTTQSEWYLAMLLDGRLVTVMGLNRQKLMHFKSDYVYETFGISVTSHRYKRLGKLFMLALTTEAFHRWMRLHTRQGIRKVRGIITTSLTKYAEGKTDRGVMQVISREQLEHGVWKILYRAEFRDEEFSTTLANWLADHGGRSRPQVGQVAAEVSGQAESRSSRRKRRRQETPT